MLIEPNPNDPINLSAAEIMRTDPLDFEKYVKLTLKGGLYEGVTYQTFI